MSDLLAARSQMAMSLAFHIIFAVVGIGMPVLMVLAERRWQKTGDRIYLELAKRWAKGTAILFAVGAVSGTVLSFELGLLWPAFMEAAGPIAGMLNPMAFQQTLHMTLASYAATGFAVAGIHAFLLLLDRENSFHRRALSVALLVGAPAALLQPISGDMSAKAVARVQPAKLAAMEAHFETGPRAPLLVGGWTDMDKAETRYAIRIPGGLSFLAFGDVDAEVKGLKDFPRDQWPHVPIVHTAFQAMVALGTYLALVSLWAAWVGWRQRDVSGDRRPLVAVALAAPMGFIAIEAGG